MAGGAVARADERPIGRESHARGSGATRATAGSLKARPTRLGRREAAVPRATEGSGRERGRRSAERSEATVFRRCRAVG